MINSELIFKNIEKFDIFPSHKSIFDTIVKNIEEEKKKKIIIRGEQFSGKSFFCRKLLKSIVNKLDININKTKIYDYPLVLFKKMWEDNIKDFNPNILQIFLKKNNINEILELNNFDFIILDDINDFLFRDLLKLEYNLNINQILIQIIEDRLYYANKEVFQKLDYKVYQINFPSMKELIEMIKNYERIFKGQSIILSNFSKDKFKSLIT